eukprot:3022125-Pleurochrysis_carterae.AAC.1
MPSATSRATVSLARVRTGFRAAPVGRLRMPRGFVPTSASSRTHGECNPQRRRQARAGGPADAQRLEEFGGLVRAVL